MGIWSAEPILMIVFLHAAKSDHALKSSYCFENSFPFARTSMEFRRTIIFKTKVGYRHRNSLINQLKHLHVSTSKGKKRSNVIILMIQSKVLNSKWWYADTNWMPTYKLERLNHESLINIVFEMLRLGIKMSTDLVNNR